jgi:hypothetical protein
VLRPLPPLLAALSLLVVACGSSPPPRSGPSTPDHRVTVTREGEETHVMITDEPPLSSNADCTAYCERLTQCWPEIPGSDPMIGAAEVRKRCLSEHSECRTATTETLCCGHVVDCNEFAQCQAKSRDRVVVCERGGRR